ncbi:MAG: MmgE/PrpD family protein [Chloroflexi bacterium]|nr:MmgE/PrpD family protein [Chloroflexota bacterium]
MDKILDQLTSYAARLDFTILPGPVVHQVKRHLLDSLACAAWGYRSEPARIAMKMAAEVTCSRPATVIGSGQRTTPELAAFANGTMIRYPEFHDAYMGSMFGCHPSDNFAAILACAEACGAGGKAVITAAVLAYEVLCRLRDAVDLRGFDSATYGAISSTSGAAKVLGLSSTQTAQAISIAVASNMALRQITRGQLSMWKRCAWPYASRSSVFAARLAAEGMTGPEAIFEGQDGFFDVVSGPFQLGAFGGEGVSFKIMETSLKRFPAGAYSQTAIDAALRLRPRLKSPEEITEVNIGTFNACLDTMAGDRQKWHPRTRETADHSLPYVVAVALTYGDVQFRHFSDACLNDESLLELVQKIRVVPDDECNQGFPGTMPNVVEVVIGDGSRLTEKMTCYRGHFRNPMSDQEIERKFLTLAEHTFSEDHARRLMHAVWNLDCIGDIRSLSDLFRVE